MPALATSAFVVLGLLDRYGPTTPYGLDRQIQEGIGHFWGFPRSQLYAEAARLVRRGMVAEQREEQGRRRRSLTITEAGRRALREWLDRPSQDPTEIHDVGLLQLFFTDRDADVTRLADVQVRAHQRSLQLYEDFLELPALRAGGPERASLELGLRFERLAIGFWTEVRASGVPSAGPGSPA